MELQRRVQRPRRPRMHLVQGHLLRHDRRRDHLAAGERVPDPGHRWHRGGAPPGPLQPRGRLQGRHRARRLRRRLHPVQLPRGAAAGVRHRGVPLGGRQRVHPRERPLGHPLLLNPGVPTLRRPVPAGRGGGQGRGRTADLPISRSTSQRLPIDLQNLLLSGKIRRSRFSWFVAISGRFWTKVRGKPGASVILERGAGPCRPTQHIDCSSWVVV